MVSLAFFNAGAKGAARTLDNRPAPPTDRILALRLRLAEALAGAVKKFRNGKNLEIATKKIDASDASDARILRRLADASDAAKWARHAANVPAVVAPPLHTDSMRLRGSSVAACHITPPLSEDAPAFYPDACAAPAVVRASVVASYVVASYCRWPAIGPLIDHASRSVRLRRWHAMRASRAYVAAYNRLPRYLTVDPGLRATLSALVPADRCDVCTVLLPVSGQPCQVCAYVPTFDSVAEAWLPEASSASAS